MKVRDQDVWVGVVLTLLLQLLDRNSAGYDK